MFVIIWYTWNMCEVRVDVWDICILLSNEMSTISELHVFLVGLSEICSLLTIKIETMIIGSDSKLNISEQEKKFVNEKLQIAFNFLSTELLTRSISLLFIFFRLGKWSSWFFWKTYSFLLGSHIFVLVIVNQAKDMWKDPPCVYIIVWHEHRYVDWDISLSHRTTESATEYCKNKKRKVSVPAVQVEWKWKVPTLSMEVSMAK